MKSGPIILIEDDPYDKGILDEVLKDLKIANTIVWFKNTADAWNYLTTTTDKPFIILCDVNLPPKTGLELKKQIDEYPEMRRKCIPFVFYSTSAKQNEVNEAYTQMTVQGFFKKGAGYEETKSDIALILEYWQRCKHPNCD